MKQPRFPVCATLIAQVFAVAYLASCGPAATLFETIDQLVNPPPPGGTLDDTFGTGGIVTTNFGPGEEGYGVAVQSDGKIVVAGFSGSALAVVRYAPNCTLDASFGSGGKVTTLIGSVSEGRAVAIQSDGRIVVAGYSFNGSNNDFAVARYTTTGALDATFGGGDGIVTTPIDPGSEVATSLAIDTDGKILVAGNSSNGSNYDFALVRYEADGNLDSGFDSGGIVTTSFGTGNDGGSAIAIQSDGKIVVAGYADISSQIDFAVARYTTDGDLDTFFSTDGKVTTPMAAFEWLDGLGLSIQEDGRIIVAGCSMSAGYNDFAVTCYNSDGTLDAAFGTSGRVTTSIGSQADNGAAVTIQNDGRIIVAGDSYIGTDDEDFALARYTTTGALDSTFGTNGIVVTTIGPKWDRCRAVAIQSDGKIVLAGMSRNDGSGNDDFAVVRYWPGLIW